MGGFVFASEEIGDVEEGEVGHEGHGGEGAGGLEPAEVFGVEGFFAEAFDDGEGDMTAIEHGEGEEVGEGEVDVEEDGEGEGEEPTAIIFEDAVVDFHDADGAAEVLGADVASFGEEGVEHIDDGEDGVADLVGGKGVDDGAVSPLEAGFSDPVGLGGVWGWVEGEGGFGLVAADDELVGLVGVFGEFFVGVEHVEDGGVIDFEEEVAFLETGLVGWGVWEDAVDVGDLARADADGTEFFSFPAWAFGFGPVGVDGEGCAVAFDVELDGIAFAANDVPFDGAERAHEAIDGVMVDGFDGVSGLEACGSGGAFGVDEADFGAVFEIVDGFTDGPDDDGEGDGEEEGEEGAGEGDDDFVEGGDGGEGLGRGGGVVFWEGIGFAFDEVHGGELGEFDEAAGWDGAEGVPDAVELFFPEGFTEPDAEFLDVKAAPASGEEVSDFVDDDDEVEEEDDAACGGEDVEQFGEHGCEG